MCFQYKWSRSRKEKIKGKGQTKQIKLASLPDFNINYHGFGKDPSISSSKFFSQGRRIPPREERLASEYQKSSKLWPSHWGNSLQVRGIDLSAISAGGSTERGTPKVHTCTLSIPNAHTFRVTHQRQGGGALHQPHHTGTSSGWYSDFLATSCHKRAISLSETLSNLTKRLFKRHAVQRRQNKRRCAVEWGRFWCWDQSEAACHAVYFKPSLLEPENWVTTTFWNSRCQQELDVP